MAERLADPTGPWRPTAVWIAVPVLLAAAWAASWIAPPPPVDEHGLRLPAPPGWMWHFSGSDLGASLAALACVALAALAWRRPQALSNALDLAAPRWSPRVVDLTVLVGATALAWFGADRSQSGDFTRVIYDLEHHVMLLSAEPLSPWMIHQQTHAAMALGMPPASALRAGFSLWGGLGAVACLHVGRALAGCCASRASGGGIALLTVGVASSGATALLLAHIETYTFAAVLMLFAVAAGLRALTPRSSDEARRRSGRPVEPWLAWGLACLAAAFHMQMLCLGPAFLFVLARGSSDPAAPEPSARWRPGRAALGLAVGIGFLASIQALAAAHPPPYPQSFGGDDGQWLVPLGELLSRSHLADVANEWITMAPGALWLAPVALATRARLRGAVVGGADARWFVALLATGWLAFALLWNPDLGAWHDWDLFAAGGWWLSVWALTWIVAHHHALTERPTGPDLRLWATVIVVLNLARTVPFVLANHGL